MGNISERCNECGRSVKPGSGWFVNRVHDLNDIVTKRIGNKPYPRGNFLCSECDEANVGTSQKKFRLWSGCGIDMGVYRGETKEDAVDAMYTDAGYSSREEVADLLKCGVSEVADGLKIEELDDGVSLADDIKNQFSEQFDEIAREEFIAEDMTLKIYINKNKIANPQDLVKISNVLSTESFKADMLFGLGTTIYFTTNRGTQDG